MALASWLEAHHNPADEISEMHKPTVEIQEATFF